MIEAIKEAPNRKVTDVQRLKESNLPNIMYGAGSYAVDVTRFLFKYGVSISDYCVDGAYVQPGQKFMDEKPVVAVEEVLAKYPKCNIVIGFADYKKAKESLQRLGSDAEIFFIDAPNHLEFFDYEYIRQHQDEFQATYDMLEDQLSRDIFVAFINAKISGDPSTLYPYADFNQYFSPPVELTDDETFVDCGAYDGDTITNFIRNVDGKYRKIFAFEPDEDNYKKLQQNLEKEGVKNVQTYNLGCWSDKAVLQFSSEGNTASIVNEGGDFSVSVDSIDNITNGEPVSYIKMDIEGAELEALKGAEKTIKAHTPKLAICAYHKPEDLIALPQYIKSLNDDYRLYLRHHQFMSWEMVLYAIPK